MRLPRCNPAHRSAAGTRGNQRRENTAILLLLEILNEFFSHRSLVGGCELVEQCAGGSGNSDGPYCHNAESHNGSPKK